MGETPEDMAALAAKAEAAGFDAAWAIELFRKRLHPDDLSGRKDRIDRHRHLHRLGFRPQPDGLAMSAMDIDEISGGRFRLGLGPGVKG